MREAAGVPAAGSHPPVAGATGILSDVAGLPVSPAEAAIGFYARTSFS